MDVEIARVSILMSTTAEQQYALELINRARSDPDGEFYELILDADSQTGVQANVTNAIRYFDVDMDLFLSQLQAFLEVAPLAWSTELATSAQTHNDLMILYDEQSHSLPGEPGVGDRITAAGYDNWSRVGENVFAYARDVLHGHAGFYIDWGGSAATGGMQDPAGHRNALLSTNYVEIGIAWDEDMAPNSAVGPNITTQHLGARWDYDPQLLGVVIDDGDGDGFYDMGEGMGGVTVTADGAEGQYVTTSWASGGYQMALPDGVYTVTFAGGGLQGTVTTQVTINGENVKADALAEDAVPDVGPPGSGDPGTGPVNTPTDGDDSLIGADTADSLFGLEGDDTLMGMDGDDVLNGGAGADFIDGGSGEDTVSYEGATRSVRVDLQNDALMYNDAVGDTFANVEVFQTGNTVDQLRGDGNDNAFHTGGLSDRLYGRAGDDLLFGETGADAFYGGMGADIMTGGDDAGRRDRFIYFNEVESGVGAGSRDVITDFVSGEDRIEISRFDADVTVGGKQAFTFIGGTAFSGVAGELGFRQEAGNTIVQADFDGDAQADFEIELTGLMTLSEADFLI